MAEAIHKGADLHCVYAAHRKGIDISALPSWDKATLMPLLGPNAKKLRSESKPINFGFPGGLGVRTFVQYARSTYGIEMTEEEARKEKEHWLNCWPEMKDHLASDDIQILAQRFRPLWQAYPRARTNGAEENLRPAVHVFKGIICGHTETSTTHRPYTQEEIGGAWDVAAQIVRQSRHINEKDRAELIRRVEGKVGGFDLWTQLAPRPRFVATLTGRLSATSNGVSNALYTAVHIISDLHRSPEDIAEVLIEEFGAFPNKSIIKTYSARPKPNYVPEYALAVATQQVIGAAGS